MTEDNDSERGHSSDEDKPKRKGRLVNPLTLKVILAVGPVVAKILHLAIELVKLFKT